MAETRPSMSLTGYTHLDSKINMLLKYVRKIMFIKYSKGWK
jgi:hypothetical protein